MRLQPLNRFGRWGVFQQPANGLSTTVFCAVVPSSAIPVALTEL